MSEIEKLFKKGESKTVGFKKTLPSGDTLARTIVSYSNMVNRGSVLGIILKNGEK